MMFPAQRRNVVWVAVWGVLLQVATLLGLGLLLLHSKVLFSLGVVAYTFGLRHAMDADHIAAIDNIMRKLVGDGQRPAGIGLFFSLGHSSIVFLTYAVVRAIRPPAGLESARGGGGGRCRNGGVGGLSLLDWRLQHSFLRAVCARAAAAGASGRVRICVYPQPGSPRACFTACLRRYDPLGRCFSSVCSSVWALKPRRKWPCRRCPPQRRGKVCS